MTAEDMAELRLLVQIDAMRRMPRRKLSECLGKHRFDTFDAAMATLKGTRLMHLANVYHCTQCRGYHVGSRMRNRMAKLYGRRRA